MKTSLSMLILVSGLVLAPLSAQAHCDSIDGPVAIAAIRSLDAKNVNLVLPYVPAEAEGELTAVFEQALVVRGQGREAEALADRYFMETAVRLHRAGENAPYTGLKPAGTDFGPAIAAAEKTLETGHLDALLALISREVTQGITEHFRHVAGKKAATKQPVEQAQVPAARDRVRVELEFIGYVENLYRATQGGGHAE